MENNILFGKPYQHKLLQRVIEATTLDAVSLSSPAPLRSTGVI